ncbi:acyl-CoA synthetase [Thermodesulfobacteriota bacterium]
MHIEYQSLMDARQHFKFKDRWKFFDADKDNLNIAYECIERHPKGDTAIRIQNDDGSRETYTFGELSQWTSQFANMLGRKGIGPGDRVAVVLPPCREFYISFFGILKRGAVVVPSFPLLGPEGIEYRFETAGVKLAVINEEREKIIRPGLVSHIIKSEDLSGLIENEDDQYATNTHADTLAVLQFSSGTTGQPKPLEYMHAAMTLTAVYVKFWFGLKKGDRFFCTSSPAWGHGIWYGTVSPLIFGNGIGAYSGKFDPEILLGALEKFKITTVSFIPRVYKMIMESEKLDNYRLQLRRLTYAGDSIDEDVVRYFKSKLGLDIGSCYGNTESGPVTLDYAYQDYTPRLGSAGVAVIGTKIGILDDNGTPLPVGEIGEAAVWRKNGWAPIGDYGYLDEDGYFFPKGRSDDVIKSSGYRIGPFEIENMLEKHPSVLKAAAVGSPHKERGEIIKAFIILNSGIKGSDALTAELQTLVKDRLSMHEYPKEIEYVDSLPETPDGKLQRKKLKLMEYTRKNDQAR